MTPVPARTPLGRSAAATAGESDEITTMRSISASLPDAPL
jgi:hypothetical protein